MAGQSDGDMVALVLNRWKGRYAPYRAWLAGFDGVVHVLGETEGLVGDEDGGLVATPVNLDAPQELSRALAHFTQQRPSAVVALAEADILLAATVREHFGCPGQRPRSAVGFRDKLVMKRVLADGGVQVADFRPLYSVADLVLAAERFGYPFMVKHRFGMGSIGTHEVSAARQFEDLVGKAIPPHQMHSFMAEQYIDGQMYCVDGVLAGGAVIFASVSWLSDGLTHLRDEAFVNYIMDQSTPLAQRLKQVAVSAVLVLADHGGDGADFTFHAELFCTPAGQIYVGEVASRTAGSRVPCTVRHTYGLQLNAVAAQLQAGLDPDLNVAPSHLTGGYTLPCSTRLPADFRLPPEWDWVLEQARTSREVSLPTTYTDSSFEAIITAADEATLAHRIRQTNALVAKERL